MLPSPARKSRPTPSLRTSTISVPMGGLNTVDSLVDMEQADAIRCYNLIGSEFGLRSRLGYSEWCTTLTGNSDNTVRTIIPYSGSAKSGSNDKLFACTSTGIWGVTASSASPTQLVAFTTTTGSAGYGTHTVTVTSAGRFLLYCDEENGYFVYTESTDTWTQVVATATTAWTASTAFLLGAYVLSGGNTYRCTTAGTTATSTAWATTTPYVIGNTRTANGNAYICTQAGTSSGAGTGPSGTGTNIIDGSCRWNYQSAAGGPTGTGTSPIADGTAAWTYVQATISGVSPGNLASVCIWKNRVWLVEKSTSKAWYLAVNAIYGTATSFDFGTKFRAGGQLANLFNWSYDAGIGMETSLVGISTAGDVVIYQGTDPSSASTFSLKGVWYVGGVVSGRRIATDYGGDLLVLSLLGVLPLSKLIIGSAEEDGKIYATQKISNLFNSLASTYKTLNAWSIHVHPTDNALLITVPQADGSATVQLAMSFATRGWSQYRELPIVSGGTWNGQFFFGTADGRVCKNDGYLDNVNLAGTSYTPVAFSVMSAFKDVGKGRQVRVHMMTPRLQAQAGAPTVRATAKFDFDLNEPAPPTGTSTSSGSALWDTAIWDSSRWGGDYTASQTISGATGLGKFLAIAVRGTAIGRTTLTGVDVYFDVGGIL
jgi:hypothetical protein